MNSRSVWVRWHATRALAGLCDTRAIAPLIDLLADDDASVRWEAARALGRLGPVVLDPLLQALSVREVTPWFAEGAARVLRRAGAGDLFPRLAGLERMLHHAMEAIAVPVEAARVREELRMLTG